jgi:hypothetical protein
LRACFLEEADVQLREVPKKADVLALLELGWSYCRIEAETGVRRETVQRLRDTPVRQIRPETLSGSDPSPQPNFLDVPLGAGPNPAKTFVRPGSNPAKTFTGSARRSRFAAGLYRTAITEKLDADRVERPPIA